MTTESHGGADRVLGLDGLRAFSIVSVIAEHASTNSDKYDSLVEPLFNAGTGVIVFFVVSGFLITRLLMSEHARAGRISLPHFYMRRALRIFPIYYLSLLLIYLISIFVYPVADGIEVLLSAAYVYNFVPKELYAGILGHTWSLAVEEHFYLIWPLAFSLMYRRHRGALLVAVTAAAFAGYPILKELMDSRFAGQDFFLARWTPVAGSYIAVGCVIALLIESPGALSARCRRLFASNAALLAAAALYVGSIAVPNAEHYFGGFIRAYGVGILIAWMRLNQGALLVRALNIAPVRFVGSISYGLYIYQGLFISNGPARAPGQTWPPKASIGVICTLVSAPLSFFFIEKPLLRLKARFR